MLHNETRELLVKAYQKTENEKKSLNVLELIQVLYIVLYRQKKTTGFVKLKTNK